MLDDRKKKVLQAIVEEYVNTAEPVSSSSLTNHEDLSYSSATIRNEMADLEKAGYLEKTHTSSGRIPSEKGYRYYVDELLQDDNISLEEIKYISDKLETKVNEIEELTKIATTTISEITHYTTVAIGPGSDNQLIQEIKFVLLGPRMLMAIILTNNGMVKETAYYPTEMFDLNEVCKKLPNDYAIIVKHHPFVKDIQSIPKEYEDRVIDLSQDTELNDLLFVTDVIITDYSSLVFEASLLDIPMVFYVFDLEKYIRERDFYFDFKLYAPGKIVYSQEQLINAIIDGDFSTERIKPFADMFFDYRDGKSTDRVVKLIYDNLK